MAAAVVGLLAIIAILLAATLALRLVEHRALAIDRQIGRRVVVHLRDSGPSIEGVVAEVAPDAIQLASAEHLGERGVRVALDGRTAIPRERLDFFQVLT
jgi:hypothetical protein